MKVLRALRPLDAEHAGESFVRRQYGKASFDGKTVPGYKEELGENSNTETFVAGGLLIDNYRWTGIPFYIPTGKRMKGKSTRIIFEFKDISMNLYYANKAGKHPNLLVINIYLDKGITLYVSVKRPAHVTSGAYTAIPVRAASIHRKRIKN